MKLDYFFISGLHGQNNNSFKIKFNDDLTILTGENGCGKTTLLKIIWYLTSPNIEHVFEEYEFDEVKLATDKYTIELKSGNHENYAKFTPIDKGTSKTIVVKKPNTANRFKINKNFDIEFIDMISDYIDDDYDSLPRFSMRLERINMRIKDLNTSSLFFPTFRRIEEKLARKNKWNHHEGELEDELSRISRKLSVDNHKFISYVATDDIKRITTNLYAEISIKAREEREKLLQRIRRIVEDNQRNKGDISETIRKIESEITNSDGRQKKLFTRYETIEQCLEEFINTKTVEIKPNIKFGDSLNTVDADCLSSGEKQILGFIAYNGCYENTPIIIDEPELSLGVDWQRKLLPILAKQTPTNQFIVATHSPLIYSRYPDKEVAL